MMMLRAMAVSAAATPMMNRVKIWPDGRVRGQKHIKGHKIQAGAVEDQFGGDQHADQGLCCNKPKIPMQNIRAPKTR